VTATDYESPALEGVRYNATRNGFDAITTRVLDWRPGSPPTWAASTASIAADVLYESHHRRGTRRRDRPHAQTRRHSRS
jgi:hypothetical protein